ncbi:hypothetical protein [Corynebacterium auris]|uniref:hypothetical protein n=1 Tax=Corynebacterium auris TaxID=44750 RepID=UPI0025B55237|nr:hypothetical protein [Corynebacterium auris]
MFDVEFPAAASLLLPLVEEEPPLDGAPLARDPEAVEPVEPVDPEAVEPDPDAEPVLAPPLATTTTPSSSLVVPEAPLPEAPDVVPPVVVPVVDVVSVPDAVFDAASAVVPDAEVTTNSGLLLEYPIVPSPLGAVVDARKRNV